MPKCSSACEGALRACVWRKVLPQPLHAPVCTGLRCVAPSFVCQPQELIQNADDAGARSVEFCLDTRQHEVSGLVGGLAAFQGPALLAFNSAKFTEDDFKSIRVGLLGTCTPAAPMPVQMCARKCSPWELLAVLTWLLERGFVCVAFSTTVHLAMSVAAGVCVPVFDCACVCVLLLVCSASVTP